MGKELLAKHHSISALSTLSIFGDSACLACDAVHGCLCRCFSQCGRQNSVPQKLWAGVCGLGFVSTGIIIACVPPAAGYKYARGIAAQTHRWEIVGEGD